MNVSERVFSNIVDSVIEVLAGNELHANFMFDLVADVRSFRKALEDIAEDGHACDCPGRCEDVSCQCPVGVALAALKKEE